MFPLKDIHRQIELRNKIHYMSAVDHKDALHSLLLPVSTAKGQNHFPIA